MTPEQETEMLAHLKTIAESLEHLLALIQVVGTAKYDFPIVQAPAELRRQQQQRRQQHRP